MKKKLFSFLFALVLIISLTASAFAVSPRLVDNAGLLSDNDSAQLLSALNSASENAGMDIVVVTVNDLEGKTVQAFADDFYDYNGYGTGEDRSGILLLVSMGTRDVYISTRGAAVNIFNDFTINSILDSIVGDLGSGNYYSAFFDFSGMCVATVESYNQYQSGYVYPDEEGEFYDISGTGTYSKPAFNSSSNGLISVIVGFFTSLISTSGMKRKLKTVKNQTNASQYVVPGSLNMTDSREIFLYHTVNRVRRAEQQRSSGGGSTTHFSSSGAVHGGGGRKF